LYSVPGKLGVYASKCLALFQLANLFDIMSAVSMLVGFEWIWIGIVSW
jgi:hypothetical protein